MSPRINALRAVIRVSKEYETDVLLRQTRDRAYLQRLSDSFTRLKGMVRVWPKKDRQLWLEQRAHLIYVLYEIFLGRYASDIEMNKRFYSWPFNDFFTVFELTISAGTYFKGVISILLKQFVAGITSFRTDVAPDPILTRSVRICYIERLIFNEIYNKVFMKKQDKAHAAELLRMKRVYDSYYPNESIKTFVVFDETEGVVPKELLLIYHKTLDNEIIQETYVKATQTTVNATRNVRKGTTSQTFKKTQTFDREVPWVRVQPGGGRRRRR